MYTFNHKRLRKESRMNQMRRSYERMTHIASEYEKVLIRYARYEDRFANKPGWAREVLERIDHENRLSSRTMQKV